MPSNYAGNNAAFVANIQIPSDGDDKPAASVNAALEGLADRSAYLKALLNGIHSFATIKEGIFTGLAQVFQSPLVMDPGGYFVDLEAAAANVDTTYDLTADGNIIIVDGGVLSAPRAYTFNKTGVQVGARCRIYTFETTHALTVKDHAGGTLAVLLNGGAPGEYEWIDIIRRGGAIDDWTLCGGQKL
jgi:hypothetical protein